MKLEIVKQVNPLIEFNYEELKAKLTEIAAKYKGLIVTEETLPDCKKSQRELASLRIELDNKLKAIKKDISAPIKALDEKRKELQDIIAEAEGPIKDGLDHFEQKRREAKMKELEKYARLEFMRIGIDDMWMRELVIPENLTNITTTDKVAHQQVDSLIAVIEHGYRQDMKNREMVRQNIDTMNKAYNCNPPLSTEDIKDMMSCMEIDPIAIGKRLKMIAEERVRAAEAAEAKALEEANKKFEDATAEPVKPIAEEDLHPDADFEVVDGPEEYIESGGPRKPEGSKEELYTLRLQLEHCKKEEIEDIMTYFREEFSPDQISHSVHKEV